MTMMTKMTMMNVMTMRDGESRMVTDCCRMSFLPNLVFRPIEQIPSWELVDDHDIDEDEIYLKSLFKRYKRSKLSDRAQTLVLVITAQNAKNV